MKKSEAVQIIEETIHDTYDYDPDLGWTVDAEAVLDKLMEAGLNKPYRWNTDVIGGWEYE